MSDKAWRLVSSIVFIAFVALFFVSYLMGGCQTTVETASGSQMHMRCYYAFIAESTISVLGIVIAIILSNALKRQVRRSIIIILWALIAIMFLLPSSLGIGICASAEMHCHMTRWVVYGILIAVALVSIVLFAKAEDDPLKINAPKK